MKVSKDALILSLTGVCLVLSIGSVSNLGQYLMLKNKRNLSFEKRFPEFVSREDMQLSLEERTLVQGEIDGTEPKGDMEKNLCSFLALKKYPPTKSVVEISNGNCIYLTPSLVLTAYHMLASDDRDFYSVDEMVKNSQGKEFLVRETVAISPRYDLALVHTYFDSPGVVAVPISKTASFPLKLELRSCGDDPMHCANITNELHIKGRREILGFNFQGKLMYPSLKVDAGVFKPGLSGSPVFQGNSLIGLASLEVEGYDIVSDHVYDFLVQVLKDSEQKGGRP